MIRSRNRRWNNGFGQLLGGLILIETGVLLFFRSYFGIEWPQMWPLFLLVPGVALVALALSRGPRLRNSSRAIE